MAELDILSPDFTREAESAWDLARNQALARGVPVFYRNDRTGLETGDRAVVDSVPLSRLASKDSE